MRDIDQMPYSPDEARVAAFFYERGIGGGDDPIGSMMAGYAFLVEQRNQLQVELDFCRKSAQQRDSSCPPTNPSTASE